MKHFLLFLAFKPPRRGRSKTGIQKILLGWRAGEGGLGLIEPWWSFWKEEIEVQGMEEGPAMGHKCPLRYPARTYECNLRKDLSKCN